MSVGDEADAKHEVTGDARPGQDSLVRRRLGRHQNPVFREENESAGRAEEPVPPRQEADPNNGEVWRTAAIALSIITRRPFVLNPLHSADFRFEGLRGADLHESKKAHRERARDGHDDAPTLNGYFISRHIECLTTEPDTGDSSTPPMAAREDPLH